MTANAWHSCGSFDRNDVLAICSDEIAALYQRLLELVLARGEIREIPQKTRITFQARMRFLSVYPRKNSLLCGFVFPRRIESPRFQKIETFSPRNHVHSLRLDRAEQLDDEFRQFLGVAQAVGRQVHLLFDLDGSREADPEIAAWWAAKPAALAAIAKRWWKVMRHIGPDVREALHNGYPAACVGVYPFAYVDAFTSHVNVGFYDGADLADPAGLLLGAGKRMRHVKLFPSEPVDATALTALIQRSYEELVSRLEL